MLNSTLVFPRMHARKLREGTRSSIIAWTSWPIVLRGFSPGTIARSVHSPFLFRRSASCPRRDSRATSLILIFYTGKLPCTFIRFTCMHVRMHVCMYTCTYDYTTTSNKLVLRLRCSTSFTDYPNYPTNSLNVELMYIEIRSNRSALSRNETAISPQVAVSRISQLIAHDGYE